MNLVAIPMLLLGSSKKKLSVVLAGSVLALIGAFVMRYEFVVAGQIYPNIPEGLPSYWPTIMEVFVVSGVVATFLLVYTLGDRFLPLKEGKAH